MTSVKVPVFMLADNAVVENGLLNVHHGGWENYGCNPFPGAVSGVVCGILEVGVDERTKPVAGHLNVRDHEGNDLGAKASFLANSTAGDGPARCPFVLPFSFVVDDVTMAEFVLTNSSGDELASLTLPIRGVESP